VSHPHGDDRHHHQQAGTHLPYHALTATAAKNKAAGTPSTTSPSSICSKNVLRMGGYIILRLQDRTWESVRAADTRLQSDCVLLDGERSGCFGSSWADAAWIATRPLRVPVIMFTADRSAAIEATTNETDRSQAAGFDAILTKPFELDDLLTEIAPVRLPLS
jgi:CheY-like chemotaxis protein